MLKCYAGVMMDKLRAPVLGSGNDTFPAKHATPPCLDILLGTLYRVTGTALGPTFLGALQWEPSAPR